MKKRNRLIGAGVGGCVGVFIASVVGILINESDIGSLQNRVEALENHKPDACECQVLVIRAAESVSGPVPPPESPCPPPEIPDYSPVNRWPAVGPSEALWKAICEVESGGNPNAVGDDGKSWGIAQIRMCVIEDINNGLDTEIYQSEDRLSVSKSCEMFQLYLLRWGGDYASDETYARIWNGGPTGWRRTSTVGFWKRVEKGMEEKKR